MADGAVDYSGYISSDKTGRCRLNLAVEGMHCPGCAMKIEKALNANDGVEARVNMTRRHLSLAWSGGKTRGNELIDAAEKLGFRLSPVANDQAPDDAKETAFLLRCMAVAGFGSGNLMIFSLALWFSPRDVMGGATQDLFHWFCALIALPTVIYSGQPFFRSAWNALAHFRTNMDVPISVGVVLATGMSFYETVMHGDHVYFDSAVMLLFLLLSGRYLDRRARGEARAAAQDILSLSGGVATVMDNGQARRIPAEQVQKGMLLAVAAGEKVMADGVIISGASEVDTAALTGETRPRAVRAGDVVLAGMINLGNPFSIRVDKMQADSLAAEIGRLMEKAAQGNARYVRIADRVAGFYTPLVHALALGTFLFWWRVMGAEWQVALMTSVTVLIITCPCALGLAVPVVQVLASQRLFRRGMLVKSAHALERLEKADTVVFDKTGTLTTGELSLEGGAPENILQLAASLAAHSRHPLSRAVARGWTGPLLPLVDLKEIPGAGMSATWQGETLRLGSAAFCGAEDGPGIWVRVGDAKPVSLSLHDSLRKDATDTVSRLRKMGLHVMMLSGDRPEAAAETAQRLGISDFVAAVDPAQKTAIIDRLASEGKHVLMVGDGINDAPSLMHADVSMSPSSAMHVTQNAADIVFQGEGVMPVCIAIAVARFSQKLVRQNFALAALYNVIAVPVAMTGHVTPLIAAIAMSVSSLAVTFNALRLNRMKEG